MERSSSLGFVVPVLLGLSCAAALVGCGGGASESLPGYTGPVADAGADQGEYHRQLVQLDGSGSTLGDNPGPLTYAWSIDSAPAGSSASLLNPTTVNPTITPDVPGDYVIQLIVNGGEDDSPPDNMTITSLNHDPIADAGPDETVKILAPGTPVALNATGSQDADNDALEYTWSLTSVPTGSGADLSSTTDPQPTFTPDLAGDYVFGLQVVDEFGGSDTATVTIMIELNYPIAEAGPDQSWGVGGTVQLDGSESFFPRGSTPSFSWLIVVAPGGSVATLSDSASPWPTFVPDVAGPYTIQLIINDGSTDSLPDKMVLTASDLNLPPVADAGPDVEVGFDVTVYLSALGSYDPNGDSLTYSWTMLGRPPTSTALLQSNTSIMPRFVTDVEGDYSFQLTVTDTSALSATDTVVLTCRVVLGSYTYTDLAHSTTALAMGDVNDDGLNDLVVTTGSYSTGDNAVYVYAQNIAGGLEPPDRYAAVTEPDSVTIGDMNGDGLNDVVVNDVGGIGVFYQNLSATLDAKAFVGSVDTDDVYKVIAGDFSGDGRTDAAGIQWDDTNYGVEVYLQSGAGVLGSSATYTASVDGRNDMTVGDFNDDGRVDLVVMSGQGLGPSLSVLLQSNSGTFLPPIYYYVSVPAGLGPSGVAAGDLDSDGLDDVVVTNGGNKPGAYVEVFRQVSAGRLARPATYIAYDIPEAVEVGDLNLDGRDDIVVVNAGWSAVTVYHQSADGRFGAFSIYPVGDTQWGMPDRLAVGDLNNDGKPDVAYTTTGTWEGFYVLYNESP